MQLLTDAQVLDLYEQSRHLLPPQRALRMLQAAFPEETPVALGRLTAGQREVRLLGIRQATFGPELECVISCPACHEPLEFALLVADLLHALPKPIGSAEGRYTIHAASCSVSFRLPTLEDLAELMADTRAAASPDTAWRQLLERCLLPSELDGQMTELARLPQQVLAEVARQMAELDPAGNLHLDLNCVACAHSWQAPIDMTAYLWDEICQRAGTLLQEVHLLARAYGWRESDILELSAWRRHAYLELAYE